MASPRSTHARTAAALLAATLAITVGIGIGRAQPGQHVMQPGETLNVACQSGLSGAIGAQAASLVCATLVPTATVTPTVAATHTHTPTPSGHPLGWHPPADHEHGDAPPVFATQFSQQQFGHGVIYGGDEVSSPMENSHKHAGFKGITATSVAGGQAYLRYHAASNPLDRSARYHSYEVYYRDVAGGVSFWQGWYDTGDPASSARCPRRSPPIACENNRPIILVTDQTSLNQGIRSEQWYMFASPAEGWGWDLGVTIIGSTTVYRQGEAATAMDQATWLPTGDLGLTRRSDGFWYLGRGEGGTNLLGRFCATSLGVVTSEGAAPCAAGSLPQYIAPTIVPDARNDGFGNRRVEWLIQKSFACSGCRLPN